MFLLLLSTRAHKTHLAKHMASFRLKVGENECNIGIPLCSHTYIHPTVLQIGTASPRSIEFMQI